MLGRIPLVSMSDRRLGGIENSSLQYFSAMRALEFSTSRMVSPSFSRSVRRFFPAGCIQRPQTGDKNHTKGAAGVVSLRNEKTLQKFVTNSEHWKNRVKQEGSDIILRQPRQCRRQLLTVGNL